MVLEIGVGEVGGEDCEVFPAVYSEIVMGYQCSHGYWRRRIDLILGRGLYFEDREELTGFARSKCKQRPKREPMQAKPADGHPRRGDVTE